MTYQIMNTSYLCEVYDVSYQFQPFFVIAIKGKFAYI